ncbi:MAG: nucleotidyltransferase [Eubacteriales bacterium]|nr:nucleotidyltransferase [Eubacteriales bacterium]
MPISEAKLETWSRQGAITTSKNTHESIRHALVSNNSNIKNKDIEIFLQGSYKNSTNIRGDSDVDVVVKLNDIYYYDTVELNEYEKSLFNRDFSKANYTWHDFREDVLDTLIDYYGRWIIEEGNKSIKIEKGSNRLPADVVVCTQYRKYTQYNGHLNNQYIEGISFFTLKDNMQIVNFPKQHYNNGVEKNRNTNGLFKPVTRIFKNMKSFLIENDYLDKTTAPSYFVENLLYNVPNRHFSGTYQNTVYNILNWLETADVDDFLCQNNVDKLLGESARQWNIRDAAQFYQNIVNLWIEGV